MKQNISVVPLGAGQEVGRSCIVVTIKDKTIIFDSGIHMGYTDMQRYPDYQFICGGRDINDVVDAVIITHFHLDHCGGLPYLTHHFKYKGPIYATTPTRAMIPYMLEDFRKVTADFKKEQKNYFTYTAGEAKACSQKITSLALQQTINYKGISITPYYAGHVLGAAMFYVEYQGLSVMYTGDYNSYADRHLGAAYAPQLNPNIIITQTTYATTIRDTKRDRERKMLKIVTETVQKGGRVLIPVFALGRAQQLAVLLQTYWTRTQNKVPVFFSAGLIEKANFYYRLFVQWENQKIKQDFLQNNIFDFKKVKPFDKTLIRAQFPYVLFATPGMLHGGTSLQVFKEWCGNPQNTLIIPGYCVPGTFGNKLLNGVKTLQIDHKEYEVNMRVENISFSAHADAKGIISLIRHVNAENIVFVHGDKHKMQIFQDVVKQQLNRPVFRPANKQKALISCTVRKQLCLSGQQELAFSGYFINKNNKGTENLKFVEEDRILRELNLMNELLGDGKQSIIIDELIETILQTDITTGQRLLRTKAGLKGLTTFAIDKMEQEEPEPKQEGRKLEIAEEGEEQSLEGQMIKSGDSIILRGDIRIFRNAISESSLPK